MRKRKKQLNKRDEDKQGHGQNKNKQTKIKQDNSAPKKGRETTTNKRTKAK